MTSPNAKRHLRCENGHEWQIVVGGSSDWCSGCGHLGEAFCACGCGASLADLRSDAVYRSEACAKRLQRRGMPDIDPTGHPLQTVRDDRTVSRHDRDLGGLIRQAIVDRIKTTGECFPDDLIPLYPEGEVDRCRELATAQFGSLAAPRGGREPLIREKGRRRSSIPARKGAKATVWEFTPAGRSHYGIVGLDRGRTLGGSSTVESGDTPSGVGFPRSTKSDQVTPPAVEVAADTGSPDHLPGLSPVSAYSAENPWA